MSANWLLLPPIQLPEIVTKPFQYSPAMACSLKLGDSIITMPKAMGAPTMIPTVPEKKVIRAFLPSPAMAFKSTVEVSKINKQGSK